MYPWYNYEHEIIFIELKQLTKQERQCQYCTITTIWYRYVLISIEIEQKNRATISKKKMSNKTLDGTWDERRGRPRSGRKINLAVERKSAFQDKAEQWRKQKSRHIYMARAPWVRGGHGTRK